ncbi:MULTISPECIES: DNZ54_00345 family protein [Enterobacter cloacae complex]|uniref:DNZ54_00345 family protein n=1 Tax=Enterobacter cloacae complex TaxID=354276 RepID=UPI00277C6D64|nr:DNZ54_00345 family protein [Enterobacter hormaechei]HDS4253616.1 peptidase [Enterobacter hormaechei subsp. steigerwaltii]ELJ5806068.1 peptidase [Enterobacter hormaechei]MCE1277267.1 DNZ54_00345 family protein [Enterobacter hormaechei]MCE1313643.1 DNZ54_00345 family protein [Enterobacter hormaechei]MDV1809882.1 DNZ54_00345 family protein [Enterobacter hormaechei]
MKKKIMNVFFQITWVVLLMAALFYPRSSAPVLVAAAVWVMSLLTWALTLCGVLGAIAGGTAKQSLNESLRKFFTAPDKPLLSWLMKILIVVCLAWSGWVITLVFYLLTLLVYRVARSQLSKTAAA